MAPVFSGWRMSPQDRCPFQGGRRKATIPQKVPRALTLAATREPRGKWEGHSARSDPTIGPDRSRMAPPLHPGGGRGANRAKGKAGPLDTARPLQSYKIWELN